MVWWIDNEPVYVTTRESLEVQVWFLDRHDVDLRGIQVVEHVLLGLQRFVGVLLPDAKKVSVLHHRRGAGVDRTVLEKKLSMLVWRGPAVSALPVAASRRDICAQRELMGVALASPSSSVIHVSGSAVTKYLKPLSA